MRLHLSCKRSSVETITRISLGCVLTGASISKFASFHPLAGTITRLTFVPDTLAPASAAALIALECAIGILLLARRSVRIAASGALALFIMFTIVLSVAIARGVELPCNCFGVFGPHLPIWAQAVLDLLLAAGAFATVRSGASSERTRWNSSPLAAGAASAAFLWGSLIVLWPYPESAPGAVARRDAGPFVETSPDTVGRPSVLLLADFDDFACQLCLDDFLAFCDSLNTERFRASVNVRLVARRDSARTTAAQARMLEGWTAGNRYLFPVSLDSTNLFGRSGMQKTCAIVLAPDGRLIDVAHFPTGSGRRNAILRAIIG